jgi:acyl carrier protein
MGEQYLVLRPGDEARAKGLSKALAEFAGVSEIELRQHPDVLEKLDADSLDLVELVLEMEDEFSC